MKTETTKEWNHDHDNKPPIFVPSFAIDPASHEPRSGKSALMNQMMAELAGKANMAETIIGNCPTSILLKSENKDANDSTVFYCRLGGFHAHL